MCVECQIREILQPHWHVTAVALIPLSLWLAASLIALTGRDYNTFIAWLKAHRF
jgi:succinate dehydrogenase hydrophobic anchor subunit